MNVWSTVPISSLYKGLYDGPHATPKPASEGPVFLGIKNVTEDGHLDLSEIRHIAEDDYPAWTRRVEPRAGDIVFTYEATLNRYAIIPPGFRGCLGRRMALIRPDPARVDTRYLYYYFFSKTWRDVVRQHTLSGSTVDRLPLTRFPEFPVAVPPLPEQRRIASILCAYDVLIENCERRIRVLDEMTRALYREWFVFRRDRGAPFRTGTWRVTSLGDLADAGHLGFQTGPFGTQLRAADYSERGIPVINVRNIGYGDVRPEKLEYLSEERARVHARHRLAVGDIVFGRKGAVDRHVLIGKSQAGWVQGSDCIRMRMATDMSSPWLLSYAFREESHKEWMLRQCSGAATMASLNQDILRRIEVTLPPRALRDPFDEFAASSAANIENLRSQAATLRSSLDILLPRLIFDQISVQGAA